MTRATAKCLIVLAIFLTVRVDLRDGGLALAQAQRPNYLYEGWHKVPDPSRIRYKVFHDKVVALSNLTTGCGGSERPFPFEGKIAKVNFDNQGLNVQNLVIEDDKGGRSLINVAPISMTDPGMNMADLGWIVQGLQTLLRPNWYFHGSIYACGAAGRVLTLDEIVSATSIKPSNPSVAIASAPTSATNGETQVQAANNNAEGIPLSLEGGTLVIPVLINGQITLNFTIDSGAADVSVPADVVSTLIRTGTVQRSDFIGQQIYRLADGSTAPSETFLIRSLKIGNHLLENVSASVAPAQADLLLGQSFLKRFNSWSIDNKRQMLLLN